MNNQIQELELDDRHRVADAAFTLLGDPQKTEKKKEEEEEEEEEQDDDDDRASLPPKAQA